MDSKWYVSLRCVVDGESIYEVVHDINVPDAHSVHRARCGCLYYSLKDAELLADQLNRSGD